MPAAHTTADSMAGMAAVSTEAAGTIEYIRSPPWRAGEAPPFMSQGATGRVPVRRRRKSLVPALRIVSAAVFLAAVAASCERGSETEKFNAAFTETAQLFVEYSLPNSMAKLPGFDLGRHLREVEARRLEASESFTRLPVFDS